MPSIDELCDEFESGFQSGNAPDIHDYLTRSAGDTSECLCQLLQIELELRIQRGEHVCERDYHQRHPDDPRAVVIAFREVERRFPAAFETGGGGKAETTARVILRVTQGPSSGQELVFTGHQTCLVGRSKEAHLRLSSDRQFSRFHCRLEINPPRVAIIDLGSTNGTLVNGEPVTSADLSSHDEVSVGDTKFTVLVEPAEQEFEQTVIMSKHGSDQCSDMEVPQVPGYVVERLVGHGSMGAVYEARRVATNERVAIKIVRPVVAVDQRAIDRFRREAAIILRLQHKRIVRSLDFRMTDDHLPYIVMEYIDEVDLKETLAAYPLATRCRIACGIMSRVLEGLHYAHRMEVVHRDLKPSNLLVYRAGRKLQVKLADFGLAKNFIDAGFSECSTSDEICGTLAYMPPEQIVNCRLAKPACDIYAAGVCLYNLISDQLPYQANTVAEQISLILNSQPRALDDYVPDLPAELTEIINKALARAPSRRFRTASEMRKALIPHSKRRRPS